MPKLIFTSRYLRAAPPEQLKNYVKYISTREGVEKIDESKQNLPATQKQKKLIQQMISASFARREMRRTSKFLSPFTSRLTTARP